MAPTSSYSFSMHRFFFKITNLGLSAKAYNVFEMDNERNLCLDSECFRKSTRQQQNKAKRAFVVDAFTQYQDGNISHAAYIAKKIVSCRVLN